MHPSHNLCDSDFLNTEIRDVTSSFIIFFYPFPCALYFDLRPPLIIIVVLSASMYVDILRPYEYHSTPYIPVFYKNLPHDIVQTILPFHLRDH